MPKAIPTGDKLATEQIRVTYVYSLLAFATLTLFGTLQILVENNSALGYLEIGGGLSILLAVAGLRLTQNSALIRHLVLLAMLTMIVVMFATGGTGGTGIFWAFIFPVSAFFLTSKKGGIIWMSIMVAIIISFIVLERLNLIVTPYDFVTFRQLLVSLIVVTVGIYVYQQSRESLAIQTQKSDVATREEKIKADIIVDNIDEGVVAVDTAGVIVLASKAASDLLGWAPGELVGKKFVDTVPMIDPNGQIVPATKRPMQRALQQQERSRTDTIYERKDGRHIPVEITSRAIIVDGKMHGAIGTFRDITEETAIDRAKSEFVTLASHQLRTPISAIAWVGELLLHGDGGKLTAEQMDYIQQIYHSNQRMAALVDAMLMVSSLELGSLPVHPKKVDLPKLCREVLAERLAAVPAKKILHVKENYDPSLPDVSFDPEIVKTIMQNLIANAFKYTQDEGNVTISIMQRGTDIVFEVGDNGVGIPTGQQPKIFTKLFRADNIKHKDTDGTGLGLFIVKTITEYVGGSMTFTSVENKGSTFTVTLPASGMVEKLGAKDAEVV